MADSAVSQNLEEAVVTGYKAKKEMAVTNSNVADAEGGLDEDAQELEKVPVRQNLTETAFFYPDLKTDSEGNVSFEFTSPEALTKWKLMFLAHTKDARAATLEKEVVNLQNRLIFYSLNSTVSTEDSIHHLLLKILDNWV